jgi:hypothetical protein
MKRSRIYPLHSLGRLWDEVMRMHKPDLMEIRNEKACGEKITILGLVRVETLANMEAEEAENEQGAKESTAVSEDDTHLRMISNVA